MILTYMMLSVMPLRESSITFYDVLRKSAVMTKFDSKIHIKMVNKSPKALGLHLYDMSLQQDYSVLVV